MRQVRGDWTSQGSARGQANPYCLATDPLPKLVQEPGLPGRLASVFRSWAVSKEMMLCVLDISERDLQDRTWLTLREPLQS